MNELIYKTETDPQRMNSWLSGGKGGGRGQIDREVGVDMYTLLFLK